MAALNFFNEIDIKEGADPLLTEIYHDMKDKSSPLELFDSYLKETKGTLKNNPHTYAKLAKLFENGKSAENVEGHFYGVTIGLRTGIFKRCNILNFLWGKLLADAPPWVGKGFSPVGNNINGINYFRKNNISLLNRISILILNSVLNLQSAAEKEKNNYGYDRKGGAFIGRVDWSVNPGSEQKKVFQINYCISSLKNGFPLKYLIDEIVEVAPGLYLGQLLFATKRLFEEYNPELQSGEYRYVHFGYFLLMDERWDTERQRLFPYTEDIWKTRASSIPWVKTPKFTNFTFAEPSDGNCSKVLLKEVMRDKEGKETVLDLLKFYSERIGKDVDINSPYFLRLGEIFNSGIAAREVRGYYHGAVVAFRNEGYIKTFNINTLNMAWPLARYFSPWTGKTFEDIDTNKLKEITDGFEEGKIPAFWGTNTYADRTPKQKYVVEAMRAVNIWLIDATGEEVSRGYDVKGFFFIARQGISVNPENNGKTVLQFNYRWKNLKTFPPDNYCIDELVQIAEGLYMGQLIYATNILEKYDPTKSSSVYDYRNFGYFLLMDDDWYARKIEIRFDITPLEG